jgi:nicotinamidase/pyrazinamidase
VTTALIIVDVQNDFADPKGSLYVAGGESVAARLAESNRRGEAPFMVDIVVATRDWHIDPGSHFDEWPVHCRAESWGAQLHPSLDNLRNLDAIFDKGLNAAAYSGFEGSNQSHEFLAEYLHSRGVAEVEVVGIATDYCVRATALDAVSAGFRTTLNLAFCVGVAPDTTAASIDELRAAGVTITEMP